MSHTPYADAFNAVADYIARFEARRGRPFTFTFTDIYERYDVQDLPLYDVMDWLVAADALRKTWDYAEWSHDTMSYHVGPNTSAVHRLAAQFQARSVASYTKRQVTAVARNLRHKFYNEALAPYRGTDHGSDLHFALADASKAPDYGFRDVERCFYEAAARMDESDPIASGVRWSSVYLQEAVQNVLDGDYPHMSWVQIPSY